MQQIWRLLMPGTCPPPASAERAGEAAWNMALDEELFESVYAENAPVLRLYLWERPAITLGRFQNVARTIYCDEAARQDIPLVRRITGGRGILHGSDLTICLTASVSALGLPPHTSVMQIYERIAAGYIGALDALGMSARMGECMRQANRDRQGDCFKTVSRADVIEQQTNRKLLGAALHRRETTVLQQASIPYQSFRLAAPLFQGNTFVSEEVSGLSPDALCAAVCNSLETLLSVRMQLSALSASERSGAEYRMNTRYLSTEWTRAGVSSVPAVAIDS
jgi:lipoyl(octanoyl) transferase